MTKTEKLIAKQAKLQKEIDNLNEKKQAKEAELKELKQSLVSVTLEENNLSIEELVSIIKQNGEGE